MIHRFVGGIAAILLLLVSCGESTTPQASPETPSPVAAFPASLTGYPRVHAVSISSTLEHNSVTWDPFLHGGPPFDFET